jgi:polysaccharide biosynthesis transport protein
MGQESEQSHDQIEPQQQGSPVAHTLMRFALAVRYRRNVVFTTMAICLVLGAIYYATAKRYYGAKAAMLVSQTGPDNLNVTMAGDEMMRRNNMPTYENMITSAKVLEGAIAKLPPGDLIDLQPYRRELWVGKLQANLRAKAVRSTNILEINYRSADPYVAVSVVQAIVQSYLDFMDQVHKGTSEEIGKVLTQERNETAEQLTKKQNELLEARRHFADMGFRSDARTLHPTLQRAVFFNESLINAQKQRVECQATLAALETAIRNREDLGQYMATVANTVGQEVLLNSLGLGNRDAYAQNNIEQNMLNDMAQLNTLQQNLGPAHPEVVSMRERIRLSDEYLRSLPERLQQRLSGGQGGQFGPWLVQIVRQKLDELTQKEQILQEKFELARAEAIDVTGQLGQIEILERDVKRLGDMNDVLLNQIASLDLKKSGQEVRVAVTEEPAVVASPVSPKLSYAVLVSVLLGFGLGLAMVQLLDTLDDRFRSVEELQSRLRVHVLSMIQQLPPSDVLGVQGLTTYKNLASAESEAFRTLRTALALAHQDARQIVITSAEPGDGKTTILANLAVCYAQAEKKTLLIDADLRRPGLSTAMNMRGIRGLSEVLHSDGDIAESAIEHIQSSGMLGLDVLPSGPRQADPTRLFGGQRFTELLAWAATVYDQVLIDSPPALTTSDTAIIGRLVDGVVIVIQPAKNRRRIVTRVVDGLSMMKIPLLGVIVNRVGSGNDSGYYGYHSSYGYGYGYGYNYSGYGHDDEDKNQDAIPDEDTVAYRDADEPDAELTEDERSPKVPALIVPRRVA